MLPSDSAAGAPALQLTLLSVQLPVAGAGLSAVQRIIVHPAVQAHVILKQDGMTCLAQKCSDMDSLWRLNRLMAECLLVGGQGKPRAGDTM